MRGNDVTEARNADVNAMAETSGQSRSGMTVAIRNRLVSSAGIAYNNGGINMKRVKPAPEGAGL
ncbi:MAG: hypothetical protein ACLPJW_07105 [Rhodomicrobium sp.]